MGIFFPCFRWATVKDEDQVPNHNDDVTNMHNNCLGSGTINQGGEIGLINHPQKEPEPLPITEPEPEPVLESTGLITCKSMISEDSILSRDEECPICFEGYSDENPRIITKCSHHFHLGCIYDWQERSALCPSCLKVMEFQELN